MVSIFSSQESAIVFVVSALVLAVTPGPGVVYIVTRTLAQGRVAGFASVLGVAAGNFANTVAAAAGLAAVLLVSSTAFLALKYAGAGYLIYLGAKALLADRRVDSGPSAPKVKAQRVFLDGFCVALLNPKTALFFAAFLPQFAVPNPPFGALVALGALFVGIALLTDGVYVLFASRVFSWLSRRRNSGKLVSRAAGISLIGLGVFAAFFGTRTAQQP
nr:LysE family translocator [Oceanococcus sp. HetDA_MAG_MS8]